MKKFAFSVIVVLLSISVCLGQTSAKSQFPGGIVYGPKAAFKIDAPNNWVLDNVSGQSSGLPCVLYIKGYNWQNSPVIMYGKIASPSFTNIDKFIAFAINELKKEDSTFYYNEFTNGRINGKKYVIMNYRGGPYHSYERALYVQMENAVGYVVFSARNEKDFNTYSNAVIEIVSTFQYKPEYINYKPK
jgi:hypothetical protein